MCHDGLSRWSAVVQMAEDVKGTTLKWEPVCAPLAEGLVCWGGGHRRMWSLGEEMVSPWNGSMNIKMGGS